jgi:hypothetical protein
MADDLLIMTNVDLYRSIAKEAAAISRRNLEEHRRPKPNGEPGYILSPDPQRASFKQAMIAIAFAGMYLEALMAIAKKRLRKSGVRYFGKSQERPRYDGKLEALGVKDKAVLQSAAHFNDVRDDLVHEDPIELSLKPSARINLRHMKNFTAQDEAEKAIELIKNVTALLRPMKP